MMTDTIPLLEGVEPTRHTGAPTKERQDAWMQGSWAGSAPIIGIPIPVRQGEQGPRFMADAVGAWSLERMGARLLLVPLWPLPTHEQVYQSLWPLMQSMDGLLLPAGTTEPDEASQREDPAQAATAEGWLHALVQLATALGMPLLAIGDGAQLWNAALGGTSGQAAHSSPERSSPQTWKRAIMRVRAHSTLASLLASALPAQESEPPPWQLAGLADDPVERLAPGLRACAQSEEGLIVAFERADDAFGLGMSGRLEWELEQPYSRATVAAFLHACCVFDAQRRCHPIGEDARERVCATLRQQVTQGQPLIGGGQGSASMQPSSVRSVERGQLVQLFPQELTGQQPGRQRRPLPTKEERNRMRQQRWKQR